MRLTAVGFIGLMGLVAVSLPALAVPSMTAGVEAHSAVIDAGVRCGPGAHYVRGHHAPNGAWVPGHCVPNR